MNDWTAERVLILKRMWANGATGTQIGEELGISRNAVIGKAHRLHLGSRPHPIKWGDGPKQPKPVRLAKPKAVVIPMPKPVRQFAIPMGKVTECRWPEGDPKDPTFHFCEAQTEPGRPYCHAHCERAYQPREIQRAAE